MKSLHYYLFIICLGFVWAGCKKDEASLPLIERGTVSDAEGNVYSTVKIGDQWWMAENLKSTKFRDGSDITWIELSASDSTWANINAAAYTYINDTISGLLYNGFAIVDARELAPLGWHIPTDEDWKKLEETIGMNASDLNETGWRGEQEAELLASKYSKGWPEGGVLFGSDQYGFNAIPGGCRIFDGRANISNQTAFWWTKTPFGNEVWYRYMDAQERRIFRQHTYIPYGMSVRCVKDE